ncbi:hypothetical protein [uncultured Azohydromonas sp.]|jgi:hypothetical protein|uniref:hypothetical protein n=1 Tax=uncultured Azohydromonas sp. TaxID=487342 RepID=UPI002633AB6C|nr:hypothetical protein [uncultured Azohydromonas sp.]
MKHPPAPDDDRRLDQALGSPLLEPPDDFTERVLAARPSQYSAAVPAGAAVRWRLAHGLKALALAAGSALGLAQALSFAWSLWAATTAGLG